MDIPTSERVRGALLGLASGDRNGGPIRMALKCAQSLVDNQGQFDPALSFQRYFEWWDPDKPADDKAFDTGSTLPAVCKAVKRFGDAPEQAALAHLQAEGNAGINGAHRTLTLALCASLPDDQLASAARQDTKYTHAHPLSVEAAGACVVVLRCLVRGGSWEEALSTARLEAPDLAKSLNPNTAQSVATAGGFAPEVVAAAVQLVCEHRDKGFDEALCRCLAFAGPNNFSPVIAGAWLGALHGADAVADRWIEANKMLMASKQYTRADYRPIVRAMAIELAQEWS